MAKDAKVSLTPKINDDGDMVFDYKLESAAKGKVVVSPDVMRDVNPDEVALLILDAIMDDLLDDVLEQLTSISPDFGTLEQYKNHVDFIALSRVRREESRRMEEHERQARLRRAAEESISGSGGMGGVLPVTHRARQAAALRDAALSEDEGAGGEDSGGVSGQQRDTAPADGGDLVDVAESGSEPDVPDDSSDSDGMDGLDEPVQPDSEVVDRVDEDDEEDER